MPSCLGSIPNNNRVVKPWLPGEAKALAKVSFSGKLIALIRAERGPLFTLPQPPGLIISPFTGELNTRLPKPLITSCQWLFSFTIE
jgi:hypothetical protein